MFSARTARPLLRLPRAQLRPRLLSTRPQTTSLSITRPRLALLALALVGTTAYTTSSFLNNRVYADTDSTAVGHYSDASSSTSQLDSESSASSSSDPKPKYLTGESLKPALKDLQTIFPPSLAQLSLTEDERLSHAQAGGTHHHPHLPDVVVYVESTEDVVKCVKWAAEWGVAVVPYSGE